ncbi:CPBP family intramembrane metalloprotease [Tropicibacter sp. R16_0]|uniref:CPBP family intramembrane glutamic endopeptidase n=1 Tax=Tropicibacter sp. R16_0 TaxID=2821102 RepID=UPI001ADA35FD|nr:CPBP family intramembrane glutamic endopeptidase [Tropicibacter sp. R16_0]MBO9449088.1 CPBP family intramembrane metalloprotease [Tropicibacter sp. R16_0]
MTANPRRQLRLQIEFVLLFLATPLVIAVLFPPSWMFPALFAFTGLGLILLHYTPGFQWAELRYGWRSWTWGEIATFTLAMSLLCVSVIYLTRPDAAFGLLRERPQLLLFIWIGYPLASALPQELLFRPLFFRRYQAILPQGRAADLLNAAIFSFAHLMYWSWIVAGMTLAGGFLFSWAYRQRGSFFYAVLLHAIAGNILFAVGLGIYFYSGNVQRPF